jgi:hypothetical protein
MQPKLIMNRDKFTVLLGIQGDRLWIKSVKAEIRIVSAIVKEGSMKNMLRRNVVLHAEQIVARPQLARVGAAWLLFDDRKNVLEPDRIGKPETAALDWT